MANLNFNTNIDKKIQLNSIVFFEFRDILKRKGVLLTDNIPNLYYRCFGKTKFYTWNYFIVVFISMTEKHEDFIKKIDELKYQDEELFNYLLDLAMEILTGKKPVYDCGYWEWSGISCFTDTHKIRH